jgi:hypothetical protein
MKRKQFVEGCGAILGLVLIAAGFVVATRSVKITIPAVAGYPETIVTFRVGLFGGDRAIGNATSLNFASSEWAAKLTGGRWKRSEGGTYVAFACEASSTACMQATNGTGTYKYVLYPFASGAPLRAGNYKLVWDVQPPGDLVSDETSVAVPEPASIVLLASGAVMLGGLFIRRRGKQRK